MRSMNTYILTYMDVCVCVCVLNETRDPPWEAAPRTGGGPCSLAARPAAPASGPARETTRASAARRPGRPRHPGRPMRRRRNPGRRRGTRGTRPGRTACARGGIVAPGQGWPSLHPKSARVARPQFELAEPTAVPNLQLRSVQSLSRNPSKVGFVLPAPVAGGCERRGRGEPVWAPGQRAFLITPPSPWPAAPLVHAHERFTVSGLQGFRGCRVVGFRVLGL